MPSSREHDALDGRDYYPESDVAALNSLAGGFGLAFSDDYVYNTALHAGNYQYVYLTDVAESSPLVDGVSKVVFFASHSIAADQQAIIRVDENTVSSLSEQVGELSVMSLGGDGRVLAVGDFTFMTEPYNVVADTFPISRQMISLSNVSRFVLATGPFYF